MKKIITGIAMLSMLVASAATVPAAAATASSPPVIFFSDLTSGPNTGGKDNNGVFVTIVGKNFGASRGASTVAVGGGQAADYPVWSDTKISFQLGSAAKTGDITVTTAAGTSNGIRFTVRNGRVFFVADQARGNGDGSYANPWKSPKDFFSVQQPGDTCYFRSGTYSGKYGNSGRSYNVSFYNSGVPSGSPDNEIAWVGYPGETAQFRADSNDVSNGAFEMTGNNQYFVIAGLSIYGRGDGREQVRLYSDNTKLVNCKIEGIKSLSYAMVGVTASNLKIWGNEMFGATSRNKLDHIVYFQSGGQSNNVDVGWNYIHDNDISVGPVFSWNIPGQTSENIVIHDNRIDCRNSSDIVRLAGIWNGAGGSITFANNIVIGAGGSLAGDSSYNAIYAGFGKVNVYHNTFYKSKGGGGNSVVNFYGSASGEVKNNIFYNESSIGYVYGNATVDSNLYYGGSGNPPAGDAHAVTADPQFVSPDASDFHLRQGSPASAKGCNVRTAATGRDYDGVPRTGGAIALGALQYYEGGALPPPADAGFTGTPASSMTIPGTNAVVPAGTAKVIGSAEGKGTVNPSRGEAVKVYFQGSGVGKFDCRIFTLTGDLVWDSSMANVQGGAFEWAPNSVASGIYLVNIKGPGIRATQKIAVLQ